MAIRDALSTRLRNTGPTPRPVTHADLYRCVGSGVVVDVGYFPGFALATVNGNDMEGLPLTVTVCVPDDDDYLILEEFLLG